MFLNFSFIIISFYFSFVASYVQFGFTLLGFLIKHHANNAQIRAVTETNQMWPFGIKGIPKGYKADQYSDNCRRFSYEDPFVKWRLRIHFYL